MADATNRPSLLVLVRHGQSQRNVVKKQNRFYLDDEARKSVKGVPDHLIELTDEGRRQAAATGTALRDTYGMFDYVVHSGYARTIQTTEEILNAYPPDERARMYVFLQKLGRTMAGRRVLVVTHGGTIWCFRYVLERWTYEEAEWRFRTETNPNCAVTAYRFGEALGRLELTDRALVHWR